MSGLIGLLTPHRLIVFGRLADVDALEFDAARIDDVSGELGDRTTATEERIETL